MPYVELVDGCRLYYKSDCFAEPWKEAETVLLVHGIGGSTAEWYAWVPALSDLYTVIRVDLRGWGNSTIPPEDYPWSMDNYVDDLASLLDEIGVKKVHFVGAKLGGRIGLNFAAARPDRLHSLTAISTPMTLKTLPNDSRQARPTRAGGSAAVRDWAHRSMDIRLGKVNPQMEAWWTDLYSQSDPSVISGVYDLAWWRDEHDILANISVPTLVLDSVAVRSADDVREWQRRIPGARLQLVPVPRGGRHLAATRPLECAAHLRRFLADLETG